MSKLGSRSLADIRILKTGAAHYAIKRMWRSDEILQLLGIESVSDTPIGSLAFYYTLCISDITCNSFYFLGLDSTTNKLCIYLVKSGVIIECSKGLASIILDRIYKLLKQ